jgi:hypothetical protein
MEHHDSMLDLSDDIIYIYIIILVCYSIPQVKNVYFSLGCKSRTLFLSVKTPLLQAGRSLQKIIPQSGIC